MCSVIYWSVKKLIWFLLLFSWKLGLVLCIFVEILVLFLLFPWKLGTVLIAISLKTWFGSYCYFIENSVWFLFLFSWKHGWFLLFFIGQLKTWFACYYYFISSTVENLVWFLLFQFKTWFGSYYFSLKLGLDSYCYFIFRSI